LKIVSIGGAHIDRHAVLQGPLVAGTSNPCNLRESFGGVARNVAENLARLGGRVALVSRVGDDRAGRAVVAQLAALGVDVAGVSVAARRPTASYTAILGGSGELVFGLADMDLYDEIAVEPAPDGMRFVDTNLPAETIARLLPAAVDAVSVVKARKLRGLLPRVSILFANLAQAASVAEVEAFADPAAAARVMRGLGACAGVVTAGARGIAVWSGDRVQTMAALPASPRNVTGAGDALIAGTLYGVSQGMPLAEAARLGLAAAAITVESGATNAGHLKAELLDARLAANQ
jgi:pseudouridine kinase